MHSFIDHPGFFGTVPIEIFHAGLSIGTFIPERMKGGTCTYVVELQLPSNRTRGPVANDTAVISERSYRVLDVYEMNGIHDYAKIEVIFMLL